MPKNKIYVAVVDDDESFARALGRLLRASGHEVETYPSAEALLASTRLPPPDCLVLDIQLGGMSGLELQQQLHELGNLTPIIFVTAHDAAEVRAEAQQAGCVAYLRKPVVGHTLLEAVAKALHPGGANASS
jgi:FixJ family two-component response regulator